jgi:hypothetical protein
MIIQINVWALGGYGTLSGDDKNLLTKLKKH